MGEGIILKALSGFYYVDDGERIYTCRGKGKFRYEKITPLVGDRVKFTGFADDTGSVDAILPRKNEFWRPAVANIDQLVLIVSEAIPTTDPFLIDRVTSIAEGRDCDSIICINKCDLAEGDNLHRIYTDAGFKTVRVSAETGTGIEELRGLLSGKISCFTGNSGVGKSSILNALEPNFSIATGEVSHKLGRGRHTTRHVELFRLSCGAVVADTPGFSSFDTDKAEVRRKEELALTFREFLPYVDECQFIGCSHIKDRGCAVLSALEEGIIPKTRHESYVRLYEQAKLIPDWQRKQNLTR